MITFFQCCPIFSSQKHKTLTQNQTHKPESKPKSNVTASQASYSYQCRNFTINSEATFNKALQHRSELGDQYIDSLKIMNTPSKKTSWFSHGPTYYFEQIQAISKHIQHLDKALHASNPLYNNGRPLNLDTFETLNNRAGVYTNRL